MVHVRDDLTHTQKPIGDWGAEALATMLADLDFPMTGHELVERAGRWRIPLPGEVDVVVADVLAAPLRGRVFRNPRDVAQLVAEHGAAAPTEYHRPMDASRESSDAPHGVDATRPIPERRYPGGEGGIDS